MGEVARWAERAPRGVMRPYLDPRAWPPRAILKTTFKMEHLKGVLTYSIRFREETNAYVIRCVRLCATV